MLLAVKKKGITKVISGGCGTMTSSYLKKFLLARLAEINSRSLAHYCALLLPRTLTHSQAAKRSTKT